MPSLDGRSARFYSQGVRPQLSVGDQRFLDRAHSAAFDAPRMLRWCQRSDPVRATLRVIEDLARRAIGDGITSGNESWPGFARIDLSKAIVSPSVDPRALGS